MIAGVSVKVSIAPEILAAVPVCLRTQRNKNKHYIQH